jgi:serine/threonine protein kinase
VIGSLLNQYRLDEVVGEGGMGVVYRAVDLNLERTVAVKVLGASIREDPEFIARFRQEARIQAGLNHLNIATLFDFFVWNDTPVAVMEFIKGETLRTLVDRGGPIPAHVALPIFVQALRGVAAGHKRGIIHRDLKPSNLMITDEGIVKITDFGIAKVRSNSSLTRVSTRVGSASYMAPEQILGRPVDEKTDIYVMGGTLYELLTGRPPFQGLSQFEIDSAHVREPPTVPTVYCANIPPGAVVAVMRALAKEPAERFATAEDFIQALPDLHGVPYVATVVDDDATRVRPELTSGGSAEATLHQSSKAANDATLHQFSEVANDATLHRPEPVQADTAQPENNGPRAGGARRVVITVVASGLLVFAAIGLLLFIARRAGDRTNHAPASTPVVAQRLRPPQQPQPERSVSATVAVPAEVSHDLTGTWAGKYVGSSGQSQLQLVNLQLQQAPNGDITGRFVYQSGDSTGEECTLEKSSYSPQSKRLRLITHCHNPDHPRYLNVPLEFDNVDPGALTIGGGHLAFHLADDVVVTLERTKA